jgi:hypothetical protein
MSGVPIWNFPNGLFLRPAKMASRDMAHFPLGPIFSLVFDAKRFRINVCDTCRTLGTMLAPIGLDSIDTLPVLLLQV